ncbi:MAG: site-specific integrase [Clostridium sp.]|nr:site-specific integrase [Clostridium sp.]
MATSKFFLDARRVKKGNPAPLKLAIRNHGKTSYVHTGILLMSSQWDAEECKVMKTHNEHRSLNMLLAKLKGSVDVEILSLSNTERILNWDALKLRDKIMQRLNPEEGLSKSRTFYDAFVEFMNLKAESTKGVYKQTLSRLNSYMDISPLAFEDITPEWLNRFDKFLAITAPMVNARGIHLRNIRAVFNYALANDYTSYYPFRKYKIRSERTRKRSLNVDDLRKIFEYPVEDYAVIYRDLFKLIFMLIGINTVDLHRLKHIANGRIEYRRAKTGRLYSIKVEPEAQEIIDKYKGEKGLLVIADRWTDHRNFRHQINKALQRIGSVRRVGKGGKKVVDVLFPELTTYWARHTWATIAADLDIPDAVISQALGHAGENSTTDIYINRNKRKVDEANRRVIDWVLYGKKE